MQVSTGTEDAPRWVLDQPILPSRQEFLLHQEAEPTGELLRIHCRPSGFYWELEGYWAELEGRELCLSPGAFDAPFFERAVLPTIALHQSRDRVAIHASAVALNSAVLFVADSGVGKSTTTHILCRDFSTRMITDDVAIIGPEGVQPGPPWVWLWNADSSQKTRTHHVNTPSGPSKIAAVVHLSRGTPSFGELSAIEGGSRLMQATFRFSNGDPRRFFVNAAKLARHIPQYRFAFQPDPSGRPAHVADLFRMIEPWLLA